MTAQDATRLADASLVERMAAGDQDALATLMHELGGPAYSLAVRITGDVHLAEEAVQDSFTGLWRSAATYDPTTGSVAAWVLGYVRNKAIDRVRHEQRRKPRTSDGAAATCVDASQVEIVDESENADPLAAAWASSQSTTVRDALGELTHEHRQVLQLAYFGGESQAEIARTLGVPIGTVKTRTLRALARLRDILDARSCEGDPR